MRRLRIVLFAFVLGAALVVGPQSSLAASPSSGTVGPLATSVAWQGQHYTLAATAEEAACPPQSVDSLNLVCDHFALTVAGRSELLEHEHLARRPSTSRGRTARTTSTSTSSTRTATRSTAPRRAVRRPRR